MDSHGEGLDLLETRDPPLPGSEAISAWSSDMETSIFYICIQEMAPMQCSPYYHVLSCGPLGGAKETEGMDMRDMRRQSIQHVQFKVVITTNHPNKLLLKILRLVCIEVDHSIPLRHFFVCGPF